MKTIEKTIKNKSKDGRGGLREGAGRKPGSKNKINKASTQTVVELMYDKTGLVYEELLVDDFLRSRVNGDTDKCFKYHQLLSNKLMPDLNHIEVDETTTVESRQAAFLKALETIGTVAQQQAQAEIIHTESPSLHADDNQPNDDK